MWARARFFRIEPGADPEQMEEQYWSRVDAAYDQWRDDQLLNSANRQSQIQYGHAEKLPN